MSSRFLAMAAAVIECWFADRACTISVSEIHKHIFIVFIFFCIFYFRSLISRFHIKTD